MRSYVEGDLATRHPVEVKKVLDQPKLQARVPIDDFHCSGKLVHVASRLQQSRPHQNRPERGAQLVRDHCQELGFGAVGGFLPGAP